MRVQIKSPRPRLPQRRPRHAPRPMTGTHVMTFETVSKNVLRPIYAGQYTELTHQRTTMRMVICIDSTRPQQRVHVWRETNG